MKLATMKLGLALSTALAMLFVGARAHAQTTGPAFPVGPYDWAVPTPGDPFPLDPSVPPFVAPLPPAIRLPPPIRVPASVPPPPNLPAPYILPERPDTVQPPAGGLQQALSEHDRMVGLGGVGPVVSSAREIALGETVTGKATFEVITDHAGRVRTARIVDVSRDREGWERFGEALRKAPVTGMRLPEEARGAWVLLEVTVGNELTSGQRRWWDYGVLVAFDVADVNAQRERIVHTRILSEVWF